MQFDNRRHPTPTPPHRGEGELGDGPLPQGEREEVCPPWVAHFLSGLIVTGSVRTAVAEADIDFDAAWALRRAEPAFAMYWDRAVRVHKAVMAGVPYFDAVGNEEEDAVH